ncbi:MAG: hypothetical protein O2913_03240 [Chloroflexi bacterium]|nr:hypothetical protein [Chloroflexota bacterium]
MSNVINGTQNFEGPIRIRPNLSSQAEREVRRDSRLRQARTCYGHLAGVAGVALLDKMVSLGWLEEAPAPASGNRVGYNLSVEGRRAMVAWGLDTEAAAKTSGNFAFGCLDWTERRQHLGGPLGRAVTAYLGERGYVGRTTGTREVSLSGNPESWLDATACQG